ncbi:AI-2E family transporter [Chitinophaga solisilvae]|uniref:AI-2E family transporter n=1 Tax=Chitinophaga solisilvae TaxID=1233460 RepID=A0A433WP60_9BACT|nr:AI-2E family transporter [Chitinophaga solisilvae]NSL91157.1 AI-2E family transporter [Chitinophaga solisilvae]
MSTRIPSTSRRIIETVLVLLLLLGLMYALFEVMKIFFGVFTFAIIFAVSFFGLFERCCRWAPRRRKLIGVIYSILLITVVVLPFVYIINTLNGHVKGVGQWFIAARVNGIPPLPEWLTSLPYVGEDIAEFWKQLQLRPKETAGIYERQIMHVLQHIVTTGAGILGMALQIVLGIIVSAVFLVSGEKILNPVRATLSHMFGEKDSKALLNAAGQAVRGVSIGVIGASLIAAVISWIGFKIAGIPFALALAAIVFFLVLIQVGPLWIWVPLVIWLLVERHTGTAVFMIIYGAALLVIDAVLKPVLIAKSGKLPFLVLFLGVIGGLVAWGFTGMFKGAIILAVFYTVFNSWMEKNKYYAQKE